MPHDLSIPKKIAPIADYYASQLQLNSGRGVDEYTNLIPIEQLPIIIEELERLLVPIGIERGLKCAEFLTACYPMAKINNKEIYMRALASVFSNYSEDLCKQAIDQITLGCKFMPTRSEVHAAITKLSNARRAKIRIARKMLEEHHRRAKEIERAEKRAKDREKFTQKHGGKSPLEVYGLNPKRMDKARGA